jgi:glycosyltransferase involved in cell wall biosynthesis
MPKLLYVTRGSFYPECAGGAELSSHYLLCALGRRGWQVEVACALSTNGSALARACRNEMVRLRQVSLTVSDTDLGYPCHRFVTAGRGEEMWAEWLEQRLAERRPDVVVGAPNPYCAMLSAAARHGYPTFYMAHNLAVLEVGKPIPDAIRVVANSPATAARLSSITPRGVGVVLEMVDPALYRVLARDRCYITFINPIPEKGVRVALQIARRLPDAAFLFVKGKWPTITAAAAAEFLRPAAALPNVTIWENQMDMRRVYAVTDLLLVPSQFLETFGRVILEAQINDIPVVAASVCGIPYVLGAGGVLVEPADDVEAYVAAIRRLRDDQRLYGQISEAALRNSRRPEFDPETQVDNFVRFVESGG